MRKNVFILASFIAAASSYSFGIDIGSPLGNMGKNMGRTGQTLNQMDQTQDGKISRDQGYHLETETGGKGSPLAESYNDEAHREYVRKRKALQKKRAQKQF